jgi:hypothetical protein
MHIPVVESMLIKDHCCHYQKIVSEIINDYALTIAFKALLCKFIIKASYIIQAVSTAVSV